MKKKRLLFFIILLVFTVSVAANNRLVTLTPNTWAENHHLPWIGISYTGKLSINGTERYIENGERKYPRSISITYDVQGDKQSKTIYSNGSSTVTGSIKVYDKFNFGEKTKVYYNYSGTLHSSIDVMSDKVAK